MLDERVPWQLRPLSPRAERASIALLKATVSLAVAMFLWLLF